MILVDTSIWVDHFRTIEEELVSLLQAGQVLTHPFVIGEIALGNLRDRSSVLASLLALPTAVKADDDELLVFIDRHQLNGRGVGLVDTHLLASARLTSNTKIWTRDKRIADVAVEMGLAYLQS